VKAWSAPGNTWSSTWARHSTASKNGWFLLHGLHPVGVTDPDEERPGEAARREVRRIWLIVGQDR
jgi:hypothetical protein